MFPPQPPTTPVVQAAEDAGPEMKANSLALFAVAVLAAAYPLFSTGHPATIWRREMEIQNLHLP